MNFHDSVVIRECDKCHQEVSFLFKDRFEVCPKCGEKMSGSYWFHTEADCSDCKMFMTNGMMHPSGRCGRTEEFCGLGKYCDQFERR